MPEESLNSPQEVLDNYEQKCCCVFVIDVSKPQNKSIIELNRAIQEFSFQIMDDPIASNRIEIAIIVFSEDLEVVFRPKLVENLLPLPEL